MTAAVNKATGEIVDDCTEPEARALIGVVRASIEGARIAITRLWSGRGWLSTGYDGWDAMCDAEFGIRLELVPSRRVELEVELARTGMSNRAIASAVGVDERQVRRDVAPDAESLPERHTGKDGKSYPGRGRAAAPYITATGIIRMPEAQRVEQIAKLADTGRSSRQIAARLGVREQHVRSIARQNDIDLPADRIVSNQRRIDPNRIVRQTVTTLEGLCIAIQQIDDYGDLDITQTPAWSKSIVDSVRVLNRLLKEIRDAL